MAEIKITKENYEAEVLKSDIPVCLDFWAGWCGPCMMLSPVVSEVAGEYEGKIKVGKINVDEENSLANEFHVSSIPTLVLMKNGRMANTAVGYMNKAQLLNFLGL